MDTTNLIAYLPFDESTTQDLCGNEWTAYGTTSIGETNAIYGTALQLNRSYLRSNATITFGGADFTISFYAKINSNSENWGGLFCAQSLTSNTRKGQLMFQRYNAESRCIFLAYDSSGTDLGNASFANFLNARHHVEFDYSHDDSTLKIFVDGILSATREMTIERLARYIFLGTNGYSQSNQRMVGSIDEFLLYDGVALHTDNFTPPTENDYIPLKLALGGSVAMTFNFDMERKVKKTVELAVDVERQISNSNFLVADFDVERRVIKSVQVNADVERILYRTWRYENSGTADSLIISGTTLTNLSDDKSVTGTAFYQTTRAKCFDLPVTSEIWLKFDVYFDGSNRWRAYNGGNNGTTGITAQVFSASGAALSFFSNDANVQQLTNITKQKQLQAVLLHMISGSTNGVIEAWVDGEKIYTYTGDVNHGQDFADIYLQSDGAGTFFSNVIISNKKLDFGDGWHSINFDVERNVIKQVEINFDVERELIAPIYVPFIGEHFNHIIGSLNLKRGGKKKIILPKKSEVYIRAVGAGIIKVYSDTNADGEITGVDYFTQNNLYARLDECETVYVEMTSTVTQQYVIKAFVRSLKGNAKLLQDSQVPDSAVDAAINFSTGGLIANREELANNFLRDLNAADYSLDFLERYCGVIYDNADTGAITGSDAGSGAIKTAQNVVPEKIPVEDWKVPDAGAVVTINGLTVHFPKIGASGTLTDVEKHILAGLNSVWIKQSLDLIEESYGLNFTAEDVSVRDISVVFIDDENSHATASTSYSYDAVYTVTSLQLIINMKYFKDIDLSSPDGLLIPSSQYYDAAGYLDRTLAHELTHAVMAVNIKNFALLSLVINEGLAELVHGIDDLRGYTSSGGGDLAAFVSSNEVEDLLLYDYSPSGNNAYYYVAGYLLLRYLAKQGQKQKSVFMPDELELTNLLISDGATDSNYNALTDNTRQILYPDVLRTLAKTCELSFDVEILSVIRVDFTADVKRALLMHVNLFPMNREDFFADENNPYVVRTNKSRLKKLRAGQSQNPFNIANNTPGMQSFEVALAEQQVTDQVRFTRVLPASADYFKQFSMNIGQWDIDIMQEFRGKYLDYEYNMRAERIQRQGRTYSCECCSDLDKLLYTQLAYKVPATTTWTSGEGTSEEKTIETVFPKASAHAESIAKALDLNFKAKENALFGDFLSTVLMDDMGGVTYNDLIRDIFGWSARIPHKMINCCIRNNTLWVIERGQEPNMIDISEAEKSEPIITRELVRTAWGSSITSNTNTTETSTKTYVPPDKVINTPDTPEEPEEPEDPEKEVYAEGKTRIDGIDVEGYTHYSYNQDGKLRKVKSYSKQKSTGNTTNTTTHHSYDSDGALRKTETTTTAKVYDERGNSTTTETKSINEKSYVTLSTGEKFLSAEYSARYEDGKLVDEQVVTHSPTRVGQGHAIAISSDGTILGESSGQNTGDDRTTPYDKAKAINTVKSTPVKTVVWNEELEEWVVGSYETKNQSTTTTVYGLSLYDSSFPIHNEDKLIQVTQDLKALNRATKETVHVTVYNFPHLIDFLDRIVLYGGVYHLSSNIARSTNDILSEQQLTLVKWDLSKVEEESEEGGE